MAGQYVPVIVAFVISAAVVGTMLLLGKLGPRQPTEVKLTAFECGNEPSGPAWGRFDVRFYLTAILFIIFDVEVIFLYPWAVVFRRLGWFGLLEMLLFIFVLGLGLAYVWRKGALEWD